MPAAGGLRAEADVRLAALGGEVVLGSLRLSPSEDPPGGGSRDLGPGAPGAAGREDLPYKVEVWDTGQEWVEQVLAVTASASIGYAAYFAATREFPNRVITLRHKNSVISRWNGPPH